MNTKKFIVAALLLLFPMLLPAGPVDSDQARQRAAAFLKTRHGYGPARSPGHRQLIDAANTAAYHAFNISGGGFVLVSASDKTKTVLGYSDRGTFDMDDAPEPFRLWLASLEKAVNAVEAGTRPVRRAPSHSFRVKSTTKNAIPVMVSSRWNQGDPYNLDCPTYDDNGQAVLSATGCVATAMAQIMYYWRWPQASTTAIPEYTTGWNDTQTTYPELPPVTFRWDDMTDTYGQNSSEASKKAVAELMRYVGQSVCMGYGPSSGAASVNTVKALKSCFGYDKNMYYASSDQYDYQSWEDLIYTELASGRPVLMNGDTSDRTGGHEWVCDGYDGDGLFHMNWGWGGMCDGYFILTVMFPDQQGIGGSTSSDGYSMGQGIVVGLQPAHEAQPEPEETVRISISDIRLERTEYSRKSVNGSFFFPITYSAGTNLLNGYRFDASFALYDAEGQLIDDNIGMEQNFEIQPGTYWPKRTCQVYFGAGLPDGTYYIKGRSRQHGTETWNDDDKAGKHFIKAVITDGTTLRLIVFPTVGLTVNSIKLIGSGGAGSELKVKANITNADAVEYYRDTYLIVDGQWVSGNCIVVPAGRTGDYYFKCRLATSGDHRFSLSTSKDEKDAFFSTTLHVGEAVKPELAVTMKSLSSPDGGIVYGDCMRLEVKVANKGQLPYQSFVEASPWKVEGAYYWKKSSSRQNISLAPGCDTTLVYVFDGLDLDGRYNFHADTDGGASANLGDFTFRQGIVYWTADGAKYGVKNAAGFVLTGDMAAVRFPGAKPVAFSFDEDVNKNIVLYFEEGASVSSRLVNALDKSGVHNLVFGAKANEFVLTDGFGSYVPQSFTAVSASYHRQDVKYGEWATLALPFAPQTVSDESRSMVLAAGGDDDTADIEVKDFAAVDGDRLFFDHTENIESCRPYIFRLIGSKTDGIASPAVSDLTFTASDAVVAASGLVSTYSTDYKFVGTTVAVAPARSYVLSPDGSTFTAVASQETAPFRAFFMANNAGAALVERLVIDGSDASSVTSVPVSGTELRQGAAVYDVSGRRLGFYDKTMGFCVFGKGVFVIDGQKYVVR